jgi:hypothetical protein
VAMKLRVMILVALLLAAVVGVYFLAAAEGLPTTQQVTTIDSAFNATTSFTYRAPITPNLLFPNQTEITPGHGNLFTSMVNRVTLSFTYSLNLTSAEAVGLSVSQSLVASTPGWNWTVNASSTGLPAPPTTTAKTTGSASMVVNLTTLLKNFRTISNETEYNPNSFVLHYTAFVLATISAPNGGATVLSEPSLNLSYSGSYFAPGNLTFHQGGVVSALTESPITSTGFYRALAATVVALLLLGLAVVGYLEWAERRGPPRPVDPEAEVSKLTEPYKDAIAMTLSLPHRENIVVMKGWEDLIHAADMLSKPVLHLENRVEGEVRHIFYVVDGAVQYVFIYGTTGRDAEQTPAASPPSRPTNGARPPRRSFLGPRTGPPKSEGPR